MISAYIKDVAIVMGKSSKFESFLGLEQQC